MFSEESELIEDWSSSKLLWSWSEMVARCVMGWVEAVSVGELITTEAGGRNG